MSRKNDLPLHDGIAEWFNLYVPRGKPIPCHKCGRMVPTELLFDPSEQVRINASASLAKPYWCRPCYFKRYLEVEEECKS